MDNSYFPRAWIAYNYCSVAGSIRIDIDGGMERDQPGRMVCRFGPAEVGVGSSRRIEQGGISVFLRDGDTVVDTWSGYGPITDLLYGTDLRLDLTPLGRQLEEVELRHHDKYA